MTRVWQSEVDALVLRQQVRVSVTAAEQYDPDFPPENLLGFIAWFDAILANIAEEYRPSATIEISSTSSYYDSHYATINVQYLRPETDDEWDQRKLSVMERVRLKREQTEAQELRALAVLKAKYGQ